jgi:predicted metal-dependent hydrolase
MKKVTYQGKDLPLQIEYHPLKKSKLEISENAATATLCYDLSSKQQKAQLNSLIEKLYRRSTEKVTKETLTLLRSFAPRPIRSIRYKKMTSRWGSASANHNLNFNIDLAKLPLDVQQYIVIHEYSHLFQMNHSRQFWATVSQFDPDYKNHRRHLRLFEKKWHREKTPI